MHLPGMIEGFDELVLSHRFLDEGEMYFSQVVGCVEDILMDDEFLKLHKDFMDTHWHEFDNNDENKLIYMDIFKEYVETIEKYIESKLKKAIPTFNMLEFEYELR